MTNLLFKCSPSVSVSSVYTSVGVWTVSSISSVGSVGGVSVWARVSVSSIPGFWFGFSFSLANQVSSSIGGDWGGISGMGVDSRWVSIGTIGGSVWVSGVSVVGIGQPWLGIRFSFGFSLSDEVSSVSGVSKSVGGVWVGTIGGVSSGVWVSSISQVRVSQPWLGISLSFRFWLSEYAGYEEGGDKEEFHFVLGVDTIGC